MLRLRLLCKCGSPACQVIQPEAARNLPVPICSDCLELLSTHLQSQDDSLFCDLYHTTWLIYDFHPHTP